MESKKNHIIQTAIPLLLKEGKAVSTEKIAKKAGVSKGALFNYFGSKQNLIDEIFLTIRKEVAENILSPESASEPFKETLFSIWKKSMSWAQKHPLHYQTALNLKAAKALSQNALNRETFFFDVLFKQISASIKRGEIINLPINYIGELLRTELALAVIFSSDQAFKSKSLDEHTKETFEIFWNGIKTEQRS